IEFTSIKSVSSVATEEHIYPIRVLLPKVVVRSIGANGQLPSPAINQLTLDLRYGAYYRFVRTERDIDTIVEGLLDLSPGREQCAASGEREVIYGANEPRDRGGEESLEVDAPSRQFTFAVGCANYTITIQCLREAQTSICRQALQNLQTLRDWRGMLEIAPT